MMIKWQMKEFQRGCSFFPSSKYNTLTCCRSGWHRWITRQNKTLNKQDNKSCWHLLLFISNAAPQRAVGGLQWLTKQNHRMVGVGRDLCVSPSPIPPSTCWPHSLMHARSDTLGFAWDSCKCVFGITVSEEGFLESFWL